MASVNTVEKNKRPTMGPEVFRLSAALPALSLNPAAMMEKMTNAHEAKYPFVVAKKGPLNVRMIAPMLFHKSTKYETQMPNLSHVSGNPFIKPIADIARIRVITATEIAYA